VTGLGKHDPYVTTQVTVLNIHIPGKLSWLQSNRTQMGLYK